MANVIDTQDRAYLESVNTPDYQPPRYIINPPNFEAIKGWPPKYWIITGDVVALADIPTQTTIDAALAAAGITANKEAEKTRIDSERILKALALVIMNELNILRAEHGLNPRTISQLKAAIKQEVDNG